MELPKRVRYDAPEGYFRARLARIEEVSIKGVEAYRPDWEILSIESVIDEYHAARSYRQQEADELADVLEVLTEGHLERVIGKDRKLIYERLQDLIGVECDIQIVHIPNKNGKHEHPFCKVVRVTRPGVLVKWENRSD